jgi:hypothetical protein
VACRTIVRHASISSQIDMYPRLAAFRSGTEGLGFNDLVWDGMAAMPVRVEQAVMSEGACNGGKDGGKNDEEKREGLHGRMKKRGEMWRCFLVDVRPFMCKIHIMPDARFGSSRTQA